MNPADTDTDARSGPTDPNEPDAPTDPGTGTDSGTGSASSPVEDRRHMVRRRALTLLIIVLLIGVPAGYLVISANQSRNSGRDKEDKYSATGLTGGAPSKLQRRLYNVPLPYEHGAAQTYETNNWKVSRLYVEFLTTNDGLTAFLRDMGSGMDKLRPGRDAIAARDRRIADWDFSGAGKWSQVTVKLQAPRPTVQLVVNRANPRYPQVYLVSRTTP
ncbi:sugar kinase [Streptomyces sp. NPDC058045]|uniref:sugar kinase n=1 Tax=Streptomyces sp. NPDC058045 TaxID=3346311 RepID=UPI0036E739C5